MSEENSLEDISTRMTEILNTPSYQNAMSGVTNLSTRMTEILNTSSYQNAMSGMTNLSTRMTEILNTPSYQNAMSGVTNLSTRMTEILNTSSYQNAMSGMTNLSTRMTEILIETLDEDVMGKMLDLSTFMELDLDKFESCESNLFEDKDDTDNLLYQKLNKNESLNKLIDMNNKIDGLIDGLNVIENKIDNSKEYTKKEKNIITKAFKKIITFFIYNLFIGVIFGLFGIEASSLDDYIIETGKEFAYSAINYINESSKKKSLKTSKKITVYKSNRKDSERTGVIAEERIVEVIHKKRNWTKVTYTDDYSDTRKEGWVFTRYLVK
ncbi:hypothetical protein [Vagococcus fluvialis]|uniref:hypothetical protein n=1 Tax=Vagococcus fluvialis TaxID=2738 RepID=UPI003D0D258E